MQYKGTFDAKQRETPWMDTIWVLLNSKEFIFYH